MTNPNLAVGKIDPEVAKTNAQTMRDIATRIDDLLTKQVRPEMEKIDDEDAMIYFNSTSTSKPSDLRAELEGQIAQFPKFKEQILAFADNVDRVAEKMKVQ